MKRALVLVEGQTEERFVKDVLREHFWAMSMDVAPTLLETKRVKQGASFRGGVTSFGKFENDVRRLLSTAGDALVTTMLDYYGLPGDFPGLNNCPAGIPIQRVRHVEAAIHNYFGRQRNFLPYLSLHEFEALLFCSSDELPRALMQSEQAGEFATIRGSFPTPEDINERPGQAPSKRIEALFPAYRKALYGPMVGKRIGLALMRSECPHFGEWITGLERFAAGS